MNVRRIRKTVAGGAVPPFIGATALIFLFLLAAGPARAQEKVFSIVSPAFSRGGEIPVEYTCQGEDVSPPLQWQGAPPGTRSLVLVVDDPDAPDPKAPRVRWVHWVLYNIPPEATGLDRDVAPGDLPPGTRQGLNDWKRTGFGGPCPPIGRHRYFHTLYALDAVLPAIANPTRARVEASMAGHVLSRAELIGTYEKTP